MISLTFKAGSDKALVASLELTEKKVAESVRVAMNEIMIDLLQRIQEKLSGEVLQTRTGRLLRSAHMEPVEQLGNKVVGKIVVGGAEASYATVQEHGGRRQYDIFPKNKRALAFFPGSSAAAAVGGSITKSFQKGHHGATYVGVPVKPGASYLKGLSFRYKIGKRKGTLKEGQFSAFGKSGGIIVKRVIHPPLPERSFVRSTEKEMAQRIQNRLRVAIAEALE